MSTVNKWSYMSPSGEIVEVTSVDGWVEISAQALKEIIDAGVAPEDESATVDISEDALDDFMGVLGYE